jgi:hypothetical protein
VSRAPLSLAALKAKANARAEAAPVAAAATVTTKPTALLRLVASVEVGDLVESLGDEETNCRYAAFVSRVVAIRDGSAS